MTTKLRVRRTDGSFLEFELESRAHMTVLDAVERLRFQKDRSLMYRHSCHHGSCGTCGALVNGKEVLMCLTRLHDLPREVTVEPLSQFPVVGDLAVDPSRLYADFPESADYLRSSEANRESAVPEEIEEFTRFENCIECGLCEVACPIEDRFIGPAALAAFNRELDKHPEREQELLDAVAVPHGARRCDRALACSRVCPLGVYPAKHIAQLRRKLDERENQDG
jgi:succinate dehydrogenase / fumarate reductase iron-sulfur subunit